MKVTQYLQKLRTPTRKFDVHTLTGHSHLGLALTSGMVCTRYAKSSVTFPLGTCKRDLETKVLPPLSVVYLVSYEATRVLGFEGKKLVRSEVSAPAMSPFHRK